MYAILLPCMPHFSHVCHILCHGMYIHICGHVCHIFAMHVGVAVPIEVVGHRCRKMRNCQPKVRQHRRPTAARTSANLRCLGSMYIGVHQPHLGSWLLLDEGRLPSRRQHACKLMQTSADGDTRARWRIDVCSATETGTSSCRRVQPRLSLQRRKVPRTGGSGLDANPRP